MNSEESSDVCRICMHEVSDATSVKGCSHVFCYHCVRQWTSTRRTPVCPICRTPIAVLILADGTEQAAEPSTSAPSDEPDLSCLDHSYFLAEVGRLLSRANTVHTRLYSEAYSCGRKGGSRQTERSLDSIQDVMGILHSYRTTLQDEERFDAEVLLQELYRLDRQLTSASAGTGVRASFEVAAHALAAAEAGTPADQWCEEDLCESEDAICDDDYSWHDADDEWPSLSSLAVSKTPGRRPMQRGVARPVRNSSGQQPQQPRRQQQGQQRQPRQQAGRAQTWGS